MREILFRGKREDNGEWVEGDFCKPCNIVFEAIGYDAVLKRDGVPVVNDFEVIPETVGEFTGLFNLTKPTVLVSPQDNPLITDYIGYVDFAFGFGDARPIIFSDPDRRSEKVTGK